MGTSVPLLFSSVVQTRPLHSTGAAVGSMVDEWLHAIDIDNGRVIAALFVDLKRAFDTVDRLISEIKEERCK